VPHRPPGGSSENGCVLVVDRDPTIADILTRPVRSLHLTIESALDGQQAVAIAHHVRVTLLLVELDLPDVRGLDVVRALRAARIEAPFIVVSSHPTVRVTVEAMALGALNVLEKPVHSDVLCAEVACAIGAATVHRGIDQMAERGRPEARQAASQPQIGEPGTPSERWRDFVLALVHTEQDLKTNGLWAKHLGVSLSVLREACRLVRIAPHDARDFARMLRAIWRSEREWKPETLLNFADARTLNKLETRSGFRGRRQASAPTLAEFFERQQWIQPDNSALLTVRQAMMGSER
jgi:FixJ family two-component response regulator